MTEAVSVFSALSRIPGLRKIIAPLGRLRDAKAERLELHHLTRPRRQQLQDEIRKLTQFAYLGDRIGLCRVLGRYKLYVDTQDVGVSSHLMLDGYWEMWVTEELVTRLRPGMIAIDIGANLGYFTMLMADLVGPQGHVHAFEPNPDIARHLRRSVHVNGFLNWVTVRPEPLGEEDQARIRLVVPEYYPGGTTVVPAADTDESALILRRLDAFPQLLDADVIKIDAEGSEQMIWRGMAGVFARGRPMVIFLEFVAARYADPGTFIDEILAEGFTLSCVKAATSPQSITRAELLASPRDEDIMLVLVR